MTNEKLLKNLDTEGYNPKLVFDYSKTDMIKFIANCNNYKNINIEFWTILIYVYFTIKKLDNIQKINLRNLRECY